MEVSYGFESIAIKQKKNICKSRLDTDISSEIIKGIIRPIPLIAANMSTVVNPEFYIKLYSAGAFAFLHRAADFDTRIKDVKFVYNHCDHVATSVGIGNQEYEIAQELIENGANTILIDIAHGYCDDVINMGKGLKKLYPHIKMVLGNTTNVDMLEEVADFCDALKIGLAQGYACETKSTAGCTEKQFSAVLKFKQRSKELGIPIISDGGIREGADVVKSIAAGANSVMMGKIFAACPESAAPIVDGKKLYAGMASEWVQNRWRNGLKPGTCAEGGVRMLDIGPSLEKVLEYYTGALRTGITYSGALDIKTLQERVEFIRLV
jgi:IMP dehydrogenase